MKIKLAVMFGGRSVEHEISVISAIQAIHAVDKDKYDVIPIYITKNNEMYVGRLVWDRQRLIKDPASGEREGRPAPESEWGVQDVPELP